MKNDTEHNNNNSKDEQELLARYIAGDKEAFQDLVNLYKDPLYAFLRRFLNQQQLVEETFQETFLQLYRSRNSFEKDKPLRPWLSQSPLIKPGTLCENSSGTTLFQLAQWAMCLREALMMFLIP